MPTHEETPEKLKEYDWRVEYRQKGCLRYEQRIFKGDTPILLERLKENTKYEFKVLCMTETKVFVKHPKVVNSGDSGRIYVGLKGIACVIGAI